MILAVRVIPNARKTGLDGRRDGEILIRVSAPALEGRANRMAAAALAEALGIPNSAVRLAAGEKSRHKKFEIVGWKPDDIAPRLAALLNQHD